MFDLANEIVADVDETVATVAVVVRSSPSCCLNSECKNRAGYAVCAECAEFSGFLGSPRFEVDPASLDCCQWIAFSASAWANHRPWDFLASENWAVETFEDGECCSVDAAASATSKDGYETSGSVVDTEISSANSVDDEFSCSSD